MELPGAQRVMVYRDVEALSLAVAQRIAELATQSIALRGRFRIALAGGQTPGRCYELLRELPLDWSRVEIYFGDERCLPPGDKDRNDAMAFDALIRHIDLPQANLHPIPAELGADQAALVYARLLDKTGALDLVLLGLGEDGHTASLFPDNAALGSDAAAVAVYGAPKPPPERVSLSLLTLNAARSKLFIVSGDGKRDALRHIAQKPAGRIVGAEWHLDRAAWPDQ